MKPAHREIISIGPSSSPRHGARIVNFFLHTQEGNGTAESLAAYLNNPANGASYHYTVRDGIVCSVVDTDRASWSCLDANARSINLCFAGSRASFTREQWLERRRDIEIAAWLACEDAKKYGYLKPVVNGRPYPLGNVACFSDHYFVTKVLGIGDHTDVGAHFPWDVFAAAVKRYLSPAPPAPVVNRIDEAAAKNAWLGKRLTAGENVCPDGRGRWAKFEAGYIYWSPTTGAHPIPNLLFESWAEYGFERGPLGYPTVDRTILPATGESIGEVQAFERGVLYRRYADTQGFFVHGAIGARWAREGYEQGRLGWPTSNEIPTEDGGRRQSFEHGSLIWHPSGVVEVQA